MSPEERLIRAHDLSISALLGDTIYNFGELVSEPMMNLNSIYIKTPIFACIQLMHPILDSLNGTQHEWLKKLLFTFNEGNIGKFEALAPLLPKEVLFFLSNTSMTILILISMQIILQENYPFLRQKICLMALIESVFKRNASDRTMSFQTIAEETRLPINEVEHLVMKALR